MLPVEPDDQSTLPLALPADRVRRYLAPGAVHLPGWLNLEQQRDLVEACRAWAAGPVRIRHTRLPTGDLMSVQTVCLGWHWSPYKYTRTSAEAGGEAVAPFPEWLADLGRTALADAYRDGRADGYRDGYPEDGGVPASNDVRPGSAGPRTVREYRPDTALINFYEGTARMGMHQDKDEKVAEPVISLSLGDSCIFRFGNTENRNRPYTDVELRSGDLFVFGGPSRFAYHGVTKVLPGTADPACGLTTGRLNLTLRVTGFG